MAKAKLQQSPQYPGITPEAIWLLAENRFHDSKAFYEEHKPQLQKLVVEPLKALVADLTPSMLAIDKQFVTNPNLNGCVSRIRRDNRFTKDKSMYRENMWVAFLRDKKAWECLPGFFADISAKGTTYGVGYYYVTPRLMQVMRQMLEEDAAPFVKAVRQAEKAGFSLSGDFYARPKKEGLSPEVDALYNRKIWEMSKAVPDMSFFGSPAFADALCRDFKQLVPFYTLMIQGVEREVETRHKEEG